MTSSVRDTSFCDSDGAVYNNPIGSGRFQGFRLPGEPLLTMGTWRVRDGRGSAAK